MIEIELIVGTMGLKNVLGDRLPKYSQALLNKAGATLKTFKAGADEFYTRNRPGQLPDETFKLKDYQSLSEMLQNDQEMLSAVEGLASWPSELQMALQVQIADVKAYLGQQLPQQTVVGTFSGSYLDPSDTDKFRFLMQANLCDDVTRYIDLLNSGAITPIESGLMRTLFPMTNDYLVIEVMDKVMEAALNKKVESWEGTWRKNALSGLLGIPIMSFSDVMTYQTGMQEKTAGRPKGPGAVQIAKMDLTENQAIQTNTLDRSKI